MTLHVPYPTPGADDLADARERGGYWGEEMVCRHNGEPCRMPRCATCPYLPEIDRFDESVRIRERLEALYPGFRYEDIVRGLTVRACL